MTRTTCVLFSPGANRNCEVKSASLWNGEFPFRTWAMMVCLFSVGGFGRHLRPKKPYTVVALSDPEGSKIGTTTGTCDFGQVRIYARCFLRASEIFIRFVLKQSQDRRRSHAATQKMARMAAFRICNMFCWQVLVWGNAICA